MAELAHTAETVHTIVIILFCSFDLEQHLAHNLGRASDAVPPEQEEPRKTLCEVRHAEILSATRGSEVEVSKYPGGEVVALLADSKKKLSRADTVVPMALPPRAMKRAASSLK